MLALLLTLSGLAVVESLNVLNLGLTSAIVYDSRLHRRSPNCPAALSFIAGLFVATAAVGITVVLGVALFPELTAVRLTAGHALSRRVGSWFGFRPLGMFSIGSAKSFPALGVRGYGDNVRGC